MQIVSSADEDIDPVSLEEALHGPDWEEWRRAMKEELEQIEKMGTWEIQAAPIGVNLVKSRFVLRYKRDVEGFINRYKARRVARTFSQIYGKDYFDTYVHIVRWETVRNLLAAAATKGAVIRQADVKNAYLNAEIEEDVYIELPPGYEEFRTLPKSKSGRPMVCKLKKCLYGTKQAGCGWYST
jgi:hypothetical protein